MTFKIDFKKLLCLFFGAQRLKGFFKNQRVGQANGSPAVWSQNVGSPDLLTFDLRVAAFRTASLHHGGGFTGKQNSGLSGEVQPEPEERMKEAFSHLGRHPDAHIRITTLVAVARIVCLLTLL